MRSQLETTPPYSGADMVADANEALQSIATNFAGPTDPAAMAWPYATWADTGNMLLKRRNAANTDWVSEGALFSGLKGIASTLGAQALTADDVVITPAKLAAAFGGANLGLTANGYQKLPSGLIIQWGTATATGFTVVTAAGTGHEVYGGSFSATFPVAFPTASLCEVAHCSASPQGGAWATATAFTTSSGLITIGGPVMAMFNPNGSMTIKWVAIGY